MIKTPTNIALLIAGTLLAATIVTAVSQESGGASRGASSSPTYEYASVRFMEDRTSIVWADGTVENVMETVGKKKFPGGEYYPKGSDYRMYWLTHAMNIMSRKGYELAHMDKEDVVMKRVVGK